MSSTEVNRNLSGIVLVTADEEPGDIGLHAIKGNVMCCGPGRRSDPEVPCPGRYPGPGMLGSCWSCLVRWSCGALVCKTTAEYSLAKARVLTWWDALTRWDALRKESVVPEDGIPAWVVHRNRPRLPNVVSIRVPHWHLSMETTEHGLPSPCVSVWLNEIGKYVQWFIQGNHWNLDSGTVRIRTVHPSTLLVTW